MRPPTTTARFTRIRSHRRSGLTLIEFLIVLGIAGFMATLASPFMFGSVGRNRLDIALAEASDALREAQFSVMSGFAPARYGVHFEAGKFVFFRGAAYAPADVNNAEHLLVDNVTITSVVLTPGGACTVATGAGNCDVHFASGDGSPVESGSIVFHGPDGTTRTVTLNAVGMVDIN